MQLTIERLHLWGASLAILLVGILAGCSPPSLSQINAFALASESLAKDAAKAFAVADSIAIDRNLYDIAATTTHGPTEATFKEPFNNDTDRENHGRIAVRLAVLDQLGAYASALKELASADLGADIDAASVELYGALTGLKKTYREATGQELRLEDSRLQLISTAVDAIGRSIVEAKRRSALKTIIIQSNNAVQDSAVLVKNDLGPDTELAKYVEQSLYNVILSLQKTYNIERQLGTSTFDERLRRLRQIKAKYEAAEASKPFFTAVSKGAGQIAKTHAALETAVKRNVFSTSEIATLLGDLQDHVKSVRDFHKKLSEGEQD